MPALHLCPWSCQCILAAILLLGTVDSQQTFSSTKNCPLQGVWPIPASCSFGQATLTCHPSLEIKANSTNPVLLEAINRYSGLLFTKFEHKKRGPLEPHLRELEVHSQESSITKLKRQRPAPYLMTVQISILNSSETIKQQGSNESYFMNVTSPVTTIVAESVWGALYGLETLSQLMKYNATTELFTISAIMLAINFVFDKLTSILPCNEFEITATPMIIRDEPSYPIRGIMLDSANHFASVDTIKRTIDVMAFNKMNVLHWHLVDSYSFPLEIPSRPELANKGSWNGKNTIYSRENIRDLQEYAQYRGIRIIPEIDVPGHAYSWGFAYPEIIVACPTINTTDIGPINVVPLDPTNNKTYEILMDVIDTIVESFPEYMLHIGGDEVQYACWHNDLDIQAWMKQRGMVTEKELEIYFENQLLDLLEKGQRRPIVWDEAFTDMGSALPKSVVVEVWDDSSLLEHVLHAGHDALFASGWYLDRQVPVENHTHWFWLDTWVDMYRVRFPDDSTTPGSILGGEAAMWSEQVSDLSIDARIWPRAFAVAERLWNKNAMDAFDAAQRIGVHRCRIAARGAPIGPIWADYCSHDTQNVAVINLGSANKDVHMTSGEISGSVQHHQASKEHLPLLPDQNHSTIAGDVSLMPPQTDDQITATLRKEVPKERLSSLDVFRGVTVALMIFVDETGSSFPPIDHCPWNGIRLADFVMPFFDFIVGVSLALSFKKFDLEGLSLNNETNKLDATTSPRQGPALRKATIRFLKLFSLGMLTQGGIDIMQYDVGHIRIMGILQRVAVCYYAVALMEIFLPRSKRYRNYNEPESTRGIMYGVPVPSSFGEECGRGILTPACNAASYIDKHVLTIQHMYFPENGGSPGDNDVTFQRLPDCSTCSPGKCVPPEDAPAWCLNAPFDPEGLVSSLNAIVTTIIGIHYGHILRRIQTPKMRMTYWTLFGVFQLLLGLVLHFTNIIPMNTDLYSISYTFVTGGTAGLALVAFYIVVDRLKYASWSWIGFKYMGMNAIVMYLCAEGGIIEYILGAFYLNKPENNLANILYPTGVFWGDSDDRPYKPTYNYQIMLWTIGFIGVWILVARCMFHRRIFITI
eukprot:gene4204-6550_t